MSGRKANDLIGLPGGAGPSYIFYNRALLDAANRPTPHALYKRSQWTWDAWLDMARATTKITPEGEWQVAGCNPHLVRCWLAANGGAEFDNYRGPTRCLYDTPPAIEALTFVSELYTRWKVTPPNVTAATSPLGGNDINAFGQGKLTLNGRWGPPISQYRTQAGFTWGLVPYPKGRGPQARMTNDFASSGTAISRRTKAPNLAWAWAKLTVDEEGQLLGVKQSGGTGMPFSTAAQEATIAELRTIPTLETPEMTVEMTRTGHGVVRLASVNQVEINAILNEELNKLWRGESSPPVAAREAAARVNRYLQDNPQ
jgi:ABC-type glycerol-3-phosphate transport system substrate-binding protein